MKSSIAHHEGVWSADLQGHLRRLLPLARKLPIRAVMPVTAPETADSFLQQRCAHTGSQHRGISDGMHVLLPRAVQPAAWHDMRHGLWQECFLVWPCCERQHGCKAKRLGPALLHTSAGPLGGCGKDSHRMRPPQPRLLPNMPGHLHAWSALPSLTQAYTQSIGSEHAEHTLTSTNRGTAAICLDERVQHCPRSTTTKGCGSGTE